MKGHDEAEKKRLGAEVKRLREKMDWSREDLLFESRKHGRIGASVITRLEQGRSLPRAATLEILAKTFGISFSELTGSLSPSAPKPAGLLAVVVDLLLILERLMHALPDEAHVTGLKQWMRQRPSVSN